MKRIDPVIQFGLILRDLRKTKGWTQEHLAGELACDRAYVSQLERGLKNPSLRTLLKLAEIFEEKLMFAGQNLTTSQKEK
ncbi:MAG: helix-turn-helix transcriptional regulator [Cyanobacteria bacterium TGS_CYA1]|nr:helix-turn-helix transcriptional regulator [Cyanobacteria bacterium TGS_CYA1]